MESLVSGIKQLNGVLIVVMPDCLLYSAWQRPGQTWDTEVVGAFFGELVRAHLDGLDAIQGWSNVAQVTLELDEALIIVRPVKEPFVVGYVFDKGAAIGWARLQVQRTLGAIEQSLDSSPAPPVEVKPVSRAAARPEPARPPAEAARAPIPPAAAPEPPRPPAPPARQESPARQEPPAEVRPAEPAARSTGTGPVRPVASQDAAPPETDKRKAEQTVSREQLPKGTRLIKYLDAHAPDTHAALLRVSLQTGLPLTLLRMPDSLSDDEFAQVEESVRRILGVEQLNF